MSPEEVLDQLKQAVITVQANVKTFESSCSEAGNQAMVMQGVFEEKINDLTEKIANIEQDKEALSTDIQSSIVVRSEEASAEVSQAIDEYLTDLETTIDTSLEGLSDEFRTAHNTTNDFIDDTVSMIETTYSEFEQLGTDYQTTINNAISKIGDIERNVSEHLDSFINTLRNDIQVNHQDLLDSYNSSINEILNSELRSRFENHGDELLGFTDNLMSSLENIGGDISDRFDELSGEIIDYAGDKATNEIKDKVNGIIDHIVGELASEVSNAIVKSQVGVSVTSATSPLLPYLIAFNKIFDALEGAISAWKSFKEGLGF